MGDFCISALPDGFDVKKLTMPDPEHPDHPVQPFSNRALFDLQVARCVGGVDWEAGLLCLNSSIQFIKRFHFCYGHGL